MSRPSKLKNYGAIDTIPNDDNDQVVTDYSHRRRRYWMIGGGFLFLLIVFALTLSFMIPSKEEEKGVNVTSFRSKNVDNDVWYTTNDQDDYIKTTVATIPFSHVTRDSGSIVDWSLLPNATNAPFPTGAFWTNLILVKTTANQGYSYPIMVYPYGYAWNDHGALQVSYPSQHRQKNDESSVQDIFIPDLTFTTKVIEEAKQKNQIRSISHFDPLSVTVQFSDHDNNIDSWWKSYLVAGSPFVTVEYQNVQQPTLHALSIFKSITTCRCETTDYDDGEEELREQQQQQQQQFLTGSCFTIQTPDSKWRLWTSEKVTLVYDFIRKTTITTTADTSITGVWRLAFLPKDEEQGKTDYAFLCKHVSVYPTSAEIQYNSEGALKFLYTTQCMNNDHHDNHHEDDLLLLALPHHLQVLSSSHTRFLSNKNATRSKNAAVTPYRTIKGNMAGVLGSTWIMKYHLPPMEEDEDDIKALDEATRTTIMKQVTKDVTRVLPQAQENVYGYGKQVARLAQLIHIAKVLGEDEESSTIIHHAVTTLVHFVTLFLEGENKDALVYDTDFGGIITKDGLNDFMGDFGNGWYNDHHFHYGYHLYACALLGRWNTSFVEEYGSSVDSLMYDIAFYSQQGKDFPLARHKSWFDGHSFASGLFPFATGKSMESSSESINGYYGAYLWSKVRQQQQLQTSSTFLTSAVVERQVSFNRLLLAMELQGIDTYWHISSTSPLDESFIKKHTMVGNLGMMDVTATTWFGTNPLYVHMINFMPITAMTRRLFSNKAYLETEFQTAISPIYGKVEMAWKGYVICDKAMAIDPNDAWKDALNLRSYELDQAISQSQVLFFISTTPGFIPNNSSTVESANSSSSSSSSTVVTDNAAADCDQHEACRDAGLVGMCCPTVSGIALGCCDTKTSVLDDSTKSAATPEKTVINSSSCSSHTRCQSLGSGECCPTPGGIYLDCCHS
mmetsp:Transcript_26055/g.39396  ORF Transcript_26055/g.39396 Transcript_26055/m.39396 type:complete len:954 (-) Transcript_26055:1036-3897(-)|eukprot:CAMPEP_0194203328 /NCGR_PEP_ID=MMETSP0156-20130528/3141_1 /TAXON_ID=33649 /ORGANISM="Thalassionema nitzschioides, Strain L26-B" /LENGTH=953 /DNA_ID=CAMNT_0038929059 /DNA_START=21 /DNA_END=2882 /DNA_ORIENTATION=+